MSVDLVVVAESWCGLPTSVHHLMPYVALDRQILWVDADVLRMSCGAGSCPSQEAHANCSAAPFEVISDLPPLPRAGHLACVTDPQRALRLVSSAAQRAGIRRPVLWLAAAVGRRLVGQLGERAVVYHRSDPAPSTAEDEADLARRADLIVAASKSAAAGFPAAKTRVLADGVSPELFATPMQPALLLPSDRPVAGFHGRIDATFDVELLAAVAGRLPHWQFMLIGPVAADAPPLPKLPNVAVIGPRPHAELPRFSQHWNAAMLLRRRPVTDRLPQQLREYLAAGAPMVGHATGLPERLRPLVTAAADVDSFVAGLVAALVESRTCRASRREALAGEVWSARAAEVAAILDGLPPRTGPRSYAGGGLTQAALGTAYGRSS